MPCASTEGRRANPCAHLTPRTPDTAPAPRGPTQYGAPGKRRQRDGARDETRRSRAAWHCAAAHKSKENGNPNERRPDGGAAGVREATGSQRSRKTRALGGGRREWQEGLRPRGGRRPRQVRQHSQFDPWTRGTGSEGCRYCFSCCRALARCLMYAKRLRTERWTLDMLAWLARAVADSKHAFLWILFFFPVGWLTALLPSSASPSRGLGVCKDKKSRATSSREFAQFECTVGMPKAGSPADAAFPKAAPRMSCCGASKLAPRLRVTPASQLHQQ